LVALADYAYTDCVHSICFCDYSEVKIRFRFRYASLGGSSYSDRRYSDRHYSDKHYSDKHYSDSSYSDTPLSMTEFYA